MFDFEKNDENEAQINQILNIVKLSSLCFPAIAFIQYFSVKFGNAPFFFQYGVLYLVCLSVILSAFILWSLLQYAVPEKIKKFVDPTVSLGIALLVVLLTGGYQSNYKFLFLFVIISSSIECNLKSSLSIASLSAVLILAIDLIFSPRALVNSYFEYDIILACVFLIISWTIGYYVSHRKKYIEGLKDLVNVDGLTGLRNHRFFYETLNEEIKVCDKEDKDVSLLFIDIDYFKYYNDLYGHQKGDEVLKIIAKIMVDFFPKAAFIARYGGEEFTVLLDGIPEDEAIKLAQGFRKTVQLYNFEGEKNLPSGNLTVSVGVASYPLKANNAEELLKNADDACYRAKFLCKNRVEVYYSILDEIKDTVFKSENESLASIKTLIAVINAKDRYTYLHVERVVFYCTLIAESISLTEEEKRNLIYSAYLHDIGKINISEDILTKMEPLTKEEWEILKDHPRRAVNIMDNLESIKDTLPIVLQHHERYDGNGYPNNLKGDEINFLASILTVVDSFDAMTSIRPYQPRKTYSQAIDELRRCSGSQFNPKAVDILINAVHDIL